ncbi:ferredoxin [Mycobacterium simiae]|uniref:ferredoxin n=1 Tax=Mycobacterium simiae TaxID=1784 RepID=UPI0026020151|nr:ferredoxin [Mycobacterium simiae]
MRIVVDRTRCASTGMCEALAPDVFEIGDDGALTIVQESPAEDRRAQMESACMDCPTQALRIDD